MRGSRRERSPSDSQLLHFSITRFARAVPTQGGMKLDALRMNRRPFHCVVASGAGRFHQISFHGSANVQPEARLVSSERGLHIPVERAGDAAEPAAATAPDRRRRRAAQRLRTGSRVVAQPPATVRDRSRRPAASRFRRQALSRVYLEQRYGELIRSSQLMPAVCLRCGWVGRWVGRWVGKWEAGEAQPQPSGADRRRVQGVRRGRSADSQPTGQPASHGPR